MLKKLHLLTCVVGLWSLSSVALAKCEPPCKQGETCRFEQPNTYYCKSYENVSGSQGEFDSGGANNMGIAGSRVPNNAGTKNQAPMAACAGKKKGCVAVRINGVEKAFSGIAPATLATLRRGLEVGQIKDYAGYISPAAADRARGNLTGIADFHDRIMGYRFADRVDPVDLREFENTIQSIMPQRNLWGNDFARDMAMIQARYGVDAMMQMMDDIKNIAMGSSGGVVDPVTATAVVSAVVATTALLYQVYKDATEEPSPYSPDGDYDGDGIPNGTDSDDDNDGVKDKNDSEPFNSGESITAETDVSLGMVNLMQLYQAAARYQQMWAGQPNYLRGI